MSTNDPIRKTFQDAMKYGTGTMIYGSDGSVTHVPYGEVFKLPEEEMQATRDPVVQAEIENDQQTEAEEQAQYLFNARLWKNCYNLLCAGEIIEFNNRTYSLRERLIDEYQQFADLFDNHYDFIAAFHRGELDPAVENLIKQEAKTLASIIVG